MTRIRTVKPELFRHVDLFEAAQATGLPLRLAYIGLFACCDRAGRFRWQPRQLSLDILPYDNIDFAAVLEALVHYGFIIKYQHEDKVYGYIPSWHKHQCINSRETESQLPDPETITAINTEDCSQNNSLNAHQPRVVSKSVTGEARVAHASRTCTRGIGREGEGEGEREEEREEEGKGKDLTVTSSTRLGARPSPYVTKNLSSEGEEAPNASHSGKPLQAEQVQHVFTHWQVTMCHPQARLDDKRKRLIAKALQSGYSVVQLCDAISGCAVTPHNTGDNERGQRYDGLHLILRDGDQIDRFIHNHFNPPQVLSQAERKVRVNMRGLQDWANKKLNNDEE
ncbi:MAG: hypothetical protein V3V61_08000 [Gammaproteobacteria bacterium]